MASRQNTSEPIFQTRAYQLEMFDYSLGANIIVVMGTGTGKTHIASLRIDTELRRTPSKYIWFTAPNAGLVDQQCEFLTSQLPEYHIKSLTGRDNVDLWSAATWRTVLKHVNVVVATPQILLDALHNAYTQLREISLLVFDEAHHCQANSPSALIMRTFYHPQKRLSGRDNLPHILGLTASPLISEKSASLAQLEENLDAVCRSPTISIDQYAQHLQKALLVKRLFTSVSQEHSGLLQSLRQTVKDIAMQDDPYYADLLSTAQKDGNDGDRARQKLRKYERSQQTPAIADIRKLFGNAEYLHGSLGRWASDLYITTCVSKWQSDTLEVNQYHDSHSSQHRQFINSILDPLRTLPGAPTLLHDAHVSAKALNLIEYLISAYHKDIVIIIFVERRAAAWALCQLLQANPSLACYGIFSYVGLSLGKVAALHEGCAIKKQDMEFMGFRQGLRNLCIATSVAEEGIDVQAVNVVIRFDDPKQLVSYVQSRGRARRENSQIVYFQDSNGEPGKYEHWAVFEKELEQLYYQQERERKQRQEYERIIEDCDESYRIESTGARLDFNVSISRLAHFCAKLPVPSDPVYILDGKIGVSMSATVLLPSAVPPLLRKANSCRTWKSENMAKRDAAFHAMQALHEAGLINDHLVPFEVEDVSTILLHEKKLRQIPPEQQVWSNSSSETRHEAYRVEITYEGKKYLSLVMILLSTPLQQTLRFPLTELSGRSIEVSIIPLGPDMVGKANNPEYLTQFLFETVFQTGSASGSLQDPSRVSCVLFPEFNDTQLNGSSIQLNDFLHHHKWLLNLQPLLVWRKTRPRPYIWYPPHIVRENIDGKPVLVAKQIRKLQIFTRDQDAATVKASLPLDKELLLEECEARGIATVYGPIVLLLPTILHYMGAAFRAQHAHQTILRPLGISATEHIIPALIAKSASGTYNYERLEFLGDACLKYLASVQMFFDYPSAPEGMLTRNTHEIIGNTRLERATNEVGLARFVTTETPAQKHWKLPSIQEDAVIPERQTLSKTLADVVESIIGAAYLDGKPNGEAIARCIEALQFFIPEVLWQAPGNHVRVIQKDTTEVTQRSLLQQKIKQMLNYDFESPALLAEALTHSTDVVTQSALDRLEFLGDAILDQVVKTKLFEDYDLDAGRMTVCRHALVSHAFLAYLTLGIHCDEVVNDVNIEDGSPHLITGTKQINLTDLIKFRETSMREPIAASKIKYDNIRGGIESELRAGRFPWTLLRSLNAPKVCSDIMESLLAALYLGSNGSLTRCEALLDRLGLMDLLKKIATNTSFEVRTPGAILRELCADCKIAVSIKARCEQGQEARQYIGEVLLGEIGGEIAITRAASCLEEAKSLAAEAATDFLFLLRQSEESNGEATEQKSRSQEMDIDTDIVMS